MPQLESFDVVILGGGPGGKLLAWSLGESGKKVAVSSAVGSAAHARPKRRVSMLTPRFHYPRS